jgi:hypothetical protein
MIAGIPCTRRAGRTTTLLPEAAVAVPGIAVRGTMGEDITDKNRKRSGGFFAEAAAFLV